MFSVMTANIYMGLPCAEPFNVLFNLTLPRAVAHFKDEDTKAQGISYQR